MNNFLRIMTMVVSGYTALYAAIWQHELGHAIIFQFYGCNPVLWDVDVPFHFGNANPGPLDSACLDLLHSEAIFHGSMGGVMVNMVMATLVFFFLGYFRKLPDLLRNWLLFFGLAHLVEVTTYFTISNIIPLSDMLGVQDYEPMLRVPLFLAGLGMAWLTWKWVRRAPSDMVPILGWYCTCSALSMGGLRLFFTFFN